MNLHRTGYRIIKKLYSQVLAIMAEHHPDPNALKKALAAGHGIDIDQVPGGDPMLFVLVDEMMAKKLKEFRIDNPTLLQLIGTSRFVALTEEEVVRKFTEAMQT